jgi:hypothetical protein
MKRGFIADLIQITAILDMRAALHQSNLTLTRDTVEEVIKRQKKGQIGLV